MKSIISTNNFKEILLESFYPNKFINYDNGIVEKKREVKLDYSRLCFTEIYFKNIKIGYGDIDLKNDITICMESDMEIVEMHFAISGFTNTTNSYGGEQYKFRENEHNLLYINGFKGKSNWYKNNLNKKQLKIFEVTLLPSIVKKYIPRNNTIFSSFFKKIIEKKNSKLFAKNGFITPEMYYCIVDIINCNKKGELKRMYLEAKVIELLMLQFEQVYDNYINKPCLKDNELKKIKMAKKIIDNNIYSYYNLSSLSKQIGSNEFFLKKGFKELYGMSVFKYLKKIKMDYAKNTLLKCDCNICEIAEKIGYKNPQHFSCAFKKHFGVSPSKLSSKT